MKKKLALLLALVMTLAAIPAMNVSAASTNRITRVIASADDGWIITNDPAQLPYVNGENPAKDSIADAAGTYLSIEMLHTAASPGDEVTLVLNNAEWDFWDYFDDRLGDMYVDSLGRDVYRPEPYPVVYTLGSTTARRNALAGIDLTNVLSFLNSGWGASIRSTYNLTSPVAATTKLYVTNGAAVIDEDTPTMTVAEYVALIADEIIAASLAAWDGGATFPNSVLASTTAVYGVSATPGDDIDEVTILALTPTNITSLGSVPGFTAALNAALTTPVNVTRTDLYGENEMFDWELRFSAVDDSIAYLYFPNGYTKGDIVRVPLCIISTADDVVKSISITNTGNTDISPSTDLVIVTGVAGTGITIPGGVVSNRDTFNINRVKVSENRAGTFRSGQFIIIAPEGYTFGTLDNIKITDTGSATGVVVKGWKVAYGVDPIFITALGGRRGTEIPASRYIVVDISIDQSAIASEFYISGLQVTIPRNSSPKFGETLKLTFIDASAGLTASQISSLSITRPAADTRILGGDEFKVVDALMRVDYGVTFDRKNEKEDIFECWSGEANVPTNRVIMQEVAPRSWWLGQDTDFIFTDGNGWDLGADGMVEIVELRVKDNNFDIPSKTYYPKDSVKVGSVTNLYVDYDSFYLGRLALTDSELISKKLFFDFQVVLNIAAGYDGPVYIEPTIRGNRNTIDLPEAVQILEVRSPITVTTVTNYVQVGYATIPVKDIRVQETEPGCFEKGYDLSFWLWAYNNIPVDTWFINNNGSAYITKNAGDGTLGSVRYGKGDKDNPGLPTGAPGISIKVTDNTKKEAFDFTISGLHVYMDRSVPEGAYNLRYAGTAWVFSEDLVDWRTIKDFLVVGTPGSNRVNTKNVIVQAGNDIAIVDGEDFELGAAPFIDPSNNRMMVPIRFIAVALGLPDNNVKWSDSDRTVTILTAEKIIQFNIGSAKVTVNGVSWDMTDEFNKPVYALINAANDRSYVPFRMLGEAFGIEVIWNDATKEAIYNPTDAQKKAAEEANGAGDNVDEGDEDEGDFEEE